MAKFNRGKPYKGISEIKVVEKDKTVLTPFLYEKLLGENPDKTISTRWHEYEKLDATPEKIEGDSV